MPETLIKKEKFDTLKYYIIKVSEGDAFTFYGRPSPVRVTEQNCFDVFKDLPSSEESQCDKVWERPSGKEAKALYHWMLGKLTKEERSRCRNITDPQENVQ